MTLSAERLQAIRERLSHASPGPWGWWDLSDGGGGWDGPDLSAMQMGPNEQMVGYRTWGLSREDDMFDRDSAVLCLDEDSSLMRCGDATFIAYAREDMELLLSEISHRSCDNQDTVKQDFVGILAHFAKDVPTDESLDFDSLFAAPHVATAVRQMIAKDPHSSRLLEKKWRADARELLSRLETIGQVVACEVNNRFLTEEEVNLLDYYISYLRITASGHDYWADLKLKRGVDSSMHRQALEENRDLHRQLEKAKKDTQIAEGSIETHRQRAAELSKENYRLRARERELVAVYRAMPYDAYLKTPHWYTTRAMALERAMNRCQMCNTTQDLQVHHRTYERLGEELPEDLTVVCRPCHAKHHGKKP